MGYFGDLFGGGSKPARYGAGEGFEPYASVSDFPVGKSLNDSILAGLGGKGWGFGDDFASRYANPAIAQREAGFNEWEQPALESQLSKRGIARSTYGVGRVLAPAMAQKERDIASMISQANLTNLQQKKADEARYQDQAQQFSSQELGARSNRASFDYGAYSDWQDRQRQYEDKRSAGAMGLTQASLGAISGLIGGLGAGAGAGGMTMTPTSQYVPGYGMTTMMTPMSTGGGGMNFGAGISGLIGGAGGGGGVTSTMSGQQIYRDLLEALQNN